MNEPIHCQYCGFEVDPTISGEPNSWPDYAELEALVAKQNEAAEHANAVIKELGELNANLTEQSAIKNSIAKYRQETSTKLVEENTKLRNAIAEHHRQKADDRCWEDDDRLYAAAGLPPCDRRVGDKAEMLKNCVVFIENRCEGGEWPSYADLMEAISRERAALHDQRETYEGIIARERADNQLLIDASQKLLADLNPLIEMLKRNKEGEA